MHLVISRAHSFPRKILPNSAGQLAKFAAHRGLLSITENCSETSVVEVWHYTKG